MSIEHVEKFLSETRVLAVVTAETPQEAENVTKALFAGGVRAIEFALRTPRAYECLERVLNRVHGLKVGVGTVLRPDQCNDVARIGAHFALAPGLSPQVVDAARMAGLPFIPGVATPSEIELALHLGCRVLKVFPCAHLGGAQYLRSLNGPFGHLNLRYVPLGGVNQRNLADYLALDSVLAVGGSWLVSASDVKEQQWMAIERKASEALALAAGGGVGT